MNHFLSITDILLEPIIGMEYPRMMWHCRELPGILCQHRTVQSWDGDWLPRSEPEQTALASTSHGASGGTGARRGMAGPGPVTSPAVPARVTHQEESLPCPLVSHGAAWWWSPAWDYSGLELGAGERLRDYSDHWSWIITWGQVTGPRVSATRGEIRPGLAGTDQMSNVDAVQCLHNSGNSLTLSNGNFTVWIGVLDDFLRFSNPNCCLESRQRM